VIIPATGALPTHFQKEKAGSPLVLAVIKANKRRYRALTFVECAVLVRE
jgi:hypothetical protein